ncbi:hypothetical protein FF1_012623 [Malus domestica]
MAIEALKKNSACLGPIVEVFFDFFIDGDGDEKEKQTGDFMAPIGRAAGKSYGGEGVGERWWFGSGAHLGVALAATDRGQFGHFGGPLGLQGAPSDMTQTHEPNGNPSPPGSQ